MNIPSPLSQSIPMLSPEVLGAELSFFQFKACQFELMALDKFIFKDWAGAHDLYEQAKNNYLSAIELITNENPEARNRLIFKILEVFYNLVMINRKCKEKLLTENYCNELKERYLSIAEPFAMMHPQTMQRYAKLIYETDGLKFERRNLLSRAEQSYINGLKLFKPEQIFTPNDSAQIKIFEDGLQRVRIKLASV